MEIAIMTSLFAKWNMKVDTGHGFLEREVVLGERKY